MACVYSCCFWFSLRLGGVLIASFSLGISLISVTATCVAYFYEKEVKEAIATCLENWNFIYVTSYAESVHDHLREFLIIKMVTSAFYSISCLLYIYGAYTCTNFFLFWFIITEFLRLLFVAAVCILGLLVLKENTMDLGLIIGASITAGFVLLGLLYLWVCAASLPALINENEKDEQAATIAHLQSLLDAQKQRHFGYGLEDDLPIPASYTQRLRGPNIPVHYRWQ